MKIKNIIFSSFFLLMSPFLFAADPEIYSHKKHGAIAGADVVAYYSLKAGEDAVIGSKDISYNYKGADWYFSSEENRDLFKESPESYVPQYGGYCAFAASKGFTKSVNPDYWHIIGGKLYLNYNYFADRKWRQDPQMSIADADKNWPALLTACEEHNNCITQ